MHTIQIRTTSVAMHASLNESQTAQLIWAALPIEGRANRWGEEIYFSIPVDAGREADARQEVDVGELGYWPEGRAFCMFFGPTPASEGSRPRAASPVNIVGEVSGDATRFRAVRDGERIVISRVEK